MPQTVLTIEDDEAIRRGIVDALEYAGYRVIEAANGNDGMDRAITNDYDLLLLDSILPGPSGVQILQELKKVRPTQPVIMLTAKGDEKSRVEGLRSGADDYVVKPFSVNELLARVEAVLRRSPERPTDLKVVDFAGGKVDFSRREIQFADGREELSEKENDLLRYLMINSGRAIARTEILSNVWRISPKNVSTRTIDMHIARLREKLRDSSQPPKILLTVRGKGYMFAQVSDLNSTQANQSEHDV